MAVVTAHLAKLILEPAKVFEENTGGFAEITGAVVAVEPGVLCAREEVMDAVAEFFDCVSGLSLDADKGTDEGSETHTMEESNHLAMAE